MTHIQEKIWNIGLVVEDIEKFPQTYKTILQDKYKDGTCQTILRRKINKLCKKGIVFVTNIPGTRFGEKIFYVFPKDYHILIVGGRMGSNVYCFFDYKKISNFYIELNKHYWTLTEGRWIKHYDKRRLFQGHVLKWI